MITHLKYTSKYVVQNYVIEEIFNDVVEFINIINSEVVNLIKKSSSDTSVSDNFEILTDITLKTNVFKKT